MSKSCLKGHFIFYLSAFLLGCMLIMGINQYINISTTLEEIKIRDKDVLRNLEIIEYEKDGNYAYLHIVGEKIRSDCGAPVRLSGFYSSPLVPFDIVDLKKNFEYGIKIPEGIEERPAIPGEQQNFDWWVISPVPDGPFYIHIDYICGRYTDSPYIKQNIFGPFELNF